MTEMVSDDNQDDGADPSLADAIRKARVDAQLTQSEAARRLGISINSLSRKELGKQSINERDLAAMERIYGAKLSGREDTEGLVVTEKATYYRRQIDDTEWSPNPALRGQIPKRAYEVAIEYCRRLVRAGLDRDEVEALERVMIDSRYAKANKRAGRTLSEDDWVLLVDDAWDAIRETLAGRGIRV